MGLLRDLHPQPHPVHRDRRPQVRKKRLHHHLRGRQAADHPGKTNPSLGRGKHVEPLLRRHQFLQQHRVHGILPQQPRHIQDYCRQVPDDRHQSAVPQKAQSGKHGFSGALQLGHVAVLLRAEGV